jgi:NAD+ synthase
VDSSLSAVLAARALGADKVLGLMMPYQSSSPASEADAAAIIDIFGIRSETIEISAMIDVYFGQIEVSSVRLGNKAARERMSILFDLAARDNRLVLGTSNKSEICLGYSTWYGDAACSFNPLAGLYKREVREMARHVGIPQRIIEKNPTADLWPDQTDESELGISYEMADKVLFQVVEKGERSLSNLKETGADEQTIRLIVDRINGYAFKRALPKIDLIGGRPIPEEVTLVIK